MKQSGPEITRQVKELLPHRYPFLLVDRIIEFDLEKSITGIKNITNDEWYFQGLPSRLMIVPASILCEAIAQLGAMLVLLEPENRDKLIFFSGLNRVRFKRPVRAGDTLLMKAEMVRRKGRVGRLMVQAFVNQKQVFRGMMQFAMDR